MNNPTKFSAIVVTFKKKNGQTWTENYSTRLLDFFIKDPDVYEVRYRDTDEVIYTRK